MHNGHLSASQVADRLSVTSRTVRRWINDGHFPNAFQLNPSLANSSFVIPIRDVERFEEQRRERQPATTEN